MMGAAGLNVPPRRDVSFEPEHQEVKPGGYDDG